MSRFPQSPQMDTDNSQTRALVPQELHEAKPLRRPPLVPERVNVFEGDQPAEEKVSAFLARVIPAAEEGRQSPAGALVAWVCDVLLSEHSLKAYGRDLAHFVGHMRTLGVDPLAVTADHMKLYKGALVKAGVRPATIARRLSVLRGRTVSLPKRASLAGRRPKISRPSRRRRWPRTRRRR